MLITYSGNNCVQGGHFENASVGAIGPWKSFGPHEAEADSTTDVGLPLVGGDRRKKPRLDPPPGSG